MHRLHSVDPLPLSGDYTRSDANVPGTLAFRFSERITVFEAVAGGLPRGNTSDGLGESQPHIVIANVSRMAFRE